MTEQSGERGTHGGCFGGQQHDYGQPVKSQVYGCVVKSCVRCGRLARASLSGRSEGASDV